MSEDMMEIIKYIEQKENELAKYSSKLRTSLSRIFAVFGDNDLCQVCNEGEYNFNHFKYTIYNEYGGCEHTNDDEKVNQLLQSGKAVLIEREKFDNIWNRDGKLIILKNKPHEFKPKIELSLEVSGEVFYTDEEGHSYKLASDEHKLIIREFDDYGYMRWYDSTDILHSVSRKVLKELVKSKAISEFLKMYIEKLDNTTEEYKAVSEIAEKMASVI